MKENNNKKKKWLKPKVSRLQFNHTFGGNAGGVKEGVYTIGGDSGTIS